MKRNYVKFNTLRNQVISLRENPFVSDDDKDVVNACYVLFRHCLTSNKCGGGCLVRGIIGCNGPDDKVNCPRNWGYAFVTPSVADELTKDFIKGGV